MTQDDMVKVARECGIGLAYGRESIERFYTFVAVEKDKEIERLREALKESVELIETLWPLEGATVRKARRALQEQPR